MKYNPHRQGGNKKHLSQWQIRKHTHKHKHTSKQTNTHTHKRAHTNTHPHTSTDLNTPTHKGTHTNTHGRTHTTKTQTQTHTQTHTKHTQTYAHTNTHKTHTQTQTHVSKPVAYSKLQISRQENLCVTLNRKFSTLVLWLDGKNIFICTCSPHVFSAPIRRVGHTGVSAVNETPAERREKKNFFLRAVNWNVLANCPFSASIKLLALRWLEQNFSKTCLLAHNSSSPPSLHSPCSQISSSDIRRLYGIISSQKKKTAVCRVVVQIHLTSFHRGDPGSILNQPCAIYDPESGIWTVFSTNSSGFPYQHFIFIVIKLSSEGRAGQ